MIPIFFGQTRFLLLRFFAFCTPSSLLIYRYANSITEKTRNIKMAKDFFSFRLSTRRMKLLRAYAEKKDKTMTQVLEELIDTLEEAVKDFSLFSLHCHPFKWVAISQRDFFLGIVSFVLANQQTKNLQYI